MFDTNFHKKIAQTSLSVFNSLPKTGKPNPKEWTVLSTIVRHQVDRCTVVAMATGSKCIGRSLMSPGGDILNDSHAEILCRRAFIRYLYNEMHEESDTLTFIGGRFKLRDGITFHFFTTHVPCGDASIFSKNDVEDVGCAVGNFEVRLESDSNYGQSRICEAKLRNDAEQSRNLTQIEVKSALNEVITTQNAQSEFEVTACKSVISNETEHEFTSATKIENADKSGSEVINNKNEVINESKHREDVEFSIEVRLESESTSSTENIGSINLVNVVKPKSEVGNDKIEVRNKIKHQLPNKSEVEASNLKRIKLESKSEVTNKSEVEAGDLKRTKMDAEDIYRTGAKCLPNDAKQDPHEEGPGYHVTGVVRTKPGRGDPTQSVSCSDKMAKWSLLGVQGALLSLLLQEPVYLSTFTITRGTPFSHDALKRALHDRLPPVELTGNYRRNLMSIAQVDATFDFAKCADKKPCPSSIIYCYRQKSEVAVEGRKQGVTKKNSKKPSSHLGVHKVELLRAFLGVARRYDIVPEEYTKCAYGELKFKSEIYRENWERVKRAFKIWTCKDGALLDFSAN